METTPPFDQPKAQAFATELREMMKRPLAYLRGALVLSLLLATAACDSSTGVNSDEEEVVDQHSNLYGLATGTPVDGAMAMLLRTPSSVGMTIEATELPPDDAFTIWWVVFNHPEHCEHPGEGLTGCDEEDLFNDAVGASVLYAAGNIADGNGESHFASILRTDDVSGCQAPFSGMGVCRDGLVNPSGAEIHLVVRTHGPVIPEMANGQINTFAEGCTPESSFDVGDGPNACEDLQFAAFLP